MKTTDMTTVEVVHKVQLVDGVFTPSEASDVLNGLIKSKINFHKIRNLSLCEGNFFSDTSLDDGRISELLQELEDFKSIYQEARYAGKKLRINGILEIEIAD